VRIEPDDEVYRVNAVWLGPEQFPFPWRATYRAYGMGLVLLLVGLAVARQLYGVTLWSFAFTLLAAIKLTQVINRRMGYERPFSAVLAMAAHEVTGPRQNTRTRGLSAAARALLREQSREAVPEPVPHGPGRRRARLGRTSREDKR